MIFKSCLAIFGHVWRKMQLNAIVRGVSIWPKLTLPRTGFDFFLLWFRLLNLRIRNLFNDWSLKCHYDQVSEWVYSFGTKKPKFKLLFFDFLVISVGSFEYWKVLFRIFLQNNKPFPVFQKYGSESLRNPIINWEHLKYFFIANIKMTIHFKESDFWVEIIT